MHYGKLGKYLRTIFKLLKTNYIYISPQHLLVATRDEYFIGFNQIKLTFLHKVSFNNYLLFRSPPSNPLPTC